MAWSPGHGTPAGGPPAGRHRSSSITSVIRVLATFGAPRRHGRERRRASTCETSRGQRQGRARAAPRSGRRGRCPKVAGVNVFGGGGGEEAEAAAELAGAARPAAAPLDGHVGVSSWTALLPSSQPFSSSLDSTLGSPRRLAGRAATVTKNDEQSSQSPGAHPRPPATVPGSASRRSRAGERETKTGGALSNERHTFERERAPARAEVAASHIGEARSEPRARAIRVQYRGSVDVAASCGCGGSRPRHPRPSRRVAQRP